MFKNDQGKYYCACHREFTHKAQAIFHIKWECGRRLKCTQTNCPYEFTTIGGLRLHMKTAHNTNLEKTDYQT